MNKKLQKIIEVYNSRQNEYEIQTDKIKYFTIKRRRLYIETKESSFVEEIGTVKEVLFCAWIGKPQYKVFKVFFPKRFKTPKERWDFRIDNSLEEIIDYIYKEVSDE